jgi:curved DNA-binding protein CbpA
MKTYYSLLNISKSASADEVKAAYRSLASKYHPDVNSDDDAAEIFKILNRAYTTLSDPDKRRDYDSLIAGGNIYRVRSDDEVVESSGAFTAYSNTLANIVFFACLSFAFVYFFQWMAEINNILWNATTIKAISAGGIFGLAVGFNSNFQARELFVRQIIPYRIIFWLILLGSILAVFSLNYQLVLSLIHH